LSEVTEQAIALLARELGLADMVRFIGQFSSGYGNYTEEREALFGELSLEQVLKEIKDRRR
jgi:hypothetical protein